ncbi:MAG TPA: hypothetical protein VNM66_02410, partial [Thermodesulfobacteriota bacterium]|nr:hypothetical protein [Thermodesulfobacteriota bacterium]
MRRALLLAAAALLALLAAALVAVRSPALRARLTAAVLEAISSRLDADVRLEGARLALLPPSLELTGLAVAPRGRPDLPPLLAVRRLRVSLDPVQLLVGRLDLDRVRLVEPELHLVVDGGRVVNLPTPAAPREPAGVRLTPVLRTVTVERGRVRVVLPAHGPLEIAFTVRRLTLRPDLAAAAADFDLGGASGEIRRPGFRQPVDRADARGRLSRAGLVVERVRGEVAGLVGEARGTIGPWGEPELRLTGSVRGPLAAVARLYADPYRAAPLALTGDLEASFRSAGPVRGAEFLVQAAARQVRLGPTAADRIALDARVTYRRTTVRAATVVAGGGAVSVRGQLDHRPPVAFEAELS